MTRETVLGIDGCPGGWVGVTLDANGQFVAPPSLWPTAAECIHSANEHALALVDIPIGLPDSPQARRRCDLESRRLLGAKRASVFFPPVRAALAATTYADACRINFAACGKKISIQSWNLAPRIREIDAHFQARPAPSTCLRESHPELCFWAMHGGRELASKKRSHEGLRQRLELLARVARNAIPFFEEAVSAFPRQKVHADDLIDAMALAATAWRGRRHGLISIPEKPQFDATGLRMEILYANF